MIVKFPCNLLTKVQEETPKLPRKPIQGEVEEESGEAFARVANKHPSGFYWLIIHNRLHWLPIEANNDVAFLVHFPKVPSEGSETINDRGKGDKNFD